MAKTTKKETNNNTPKVISILGQDYKIIESVDECNKYNADGLSDYYAKIIYIRPVSKMFDGSDNIDKVLKQRRYNEVLRHEIVHSFFDESGLDNYSKDEQLVDWIARQYNKICDVYTRLNI